MSTNEKPLRITPGPWTPVRDPGYPTYYPNLGWNVHAGEDVLFRGTDNEHCRANAELVARAPETAAKRDRLREINAELVAVLEAVLQIAELYAKRRQYEDQSTEFAAGAATLRELCEQARSALARAKGE